MIRPASLPTGKPPLPLLQRLLRRFAVRDPRVLVGPRAGEDAALLDLGDRVLVAKADPITFVAEDIGWYAVNVNANDVATRGAVPRWFLMTLLLPEGRTDEGMVAAIFDQVEAACASLDITVVGGHTEVTAGLDRPLLAGAMLGEVTREGLVTTAGVRPGDRLLLTKGIAIEGASILARECAEALAARGIPEAVVRRARGFLRDPGISVFREARLAATASRVHAMHDPTEGGLATGLHEMAEAAGVGLRIFRERIAILPECGAMCQALGLDPLGTIASGALLVALPAAEVPGLLAAYREAGIPCAEIGEAVPPAEGIRLIEADGTALPLARFDQDEIARLLAGRDPR